MKETEDGFVRAPENKGAVINTDNNGLLAYKRKKQKAKEQDNLARDVQELKAKISNIEGMFSQILEKLNK